MYVCDRCHHSVAPHVRLTRRVAERRPTRYPPRPQALCVRVKGRPRWKDDPGGEGWEVVREEWVCPTCAEA